MESLGLWFQCDDSLVHEIKTTTFRMKLIFLLGIAAAAQWSTQDYELFDVSRALEKAEGANTTFYSFLNVSSRATTDEISKAYRKRSLQLHPDKNHGVKDAQARFERLGLIAKILRTPDVRERYDHFYRNGFPKWKGTGYFYSRYRPGVGAVLLLLFFVVSGFHWLGMYIAAASHRARINGHIKDAYEAAGYPNLTKKKRVTTETGRVFSVEPTGEVYLVQGEEYLMSPDEVPSATFSRTLIARVPAVLYKMTIGRFLVRDEVEEEEGSDGSDVEVIKTIEAGSDSVSVDRKRKQIRKRN